MEVVAHDPFLAEADVPLVAFDELVATSDVISVHAPLTPETRNLFDQATFASTKPGVVFVNTARGGLVDHDALVGALDSGQVGSAALDVTEPEPLPADHSLLARDDVFVTPHIASATDRGKRRLYEHAIGNALAVIAGDPNETCVNPAVLDR
jgi:phosphoglycerate dehydrogenase-like enzyme